MSNEQEREAFEASMQEIVLGPWMLDKIKGDYTFPAMRFAWEAWQARAALAATPAPAPQPLRDAQEQPFEDWWEREGQFCRAGGSAYEKTFAWNAWCAALAATPAPETQAEELAITNKLLADCQRVLDAVPSCPAHGACIPHALEWIEKAKEAMAATPAPEPQPVQDLPPLPEPCPMVHPTGWIRYTADQMRDYARAALAATPPKAQQADRAAMWKALHAAEGAFAVLSRSLVLKEAIDALRERLAATDWEEA